MKWIYFQVFNFFYRINLILKPSFETELSMSAFFTSLYFPSLIFLFIQGFYSIITGITVYDSLNNSLNFICFIIYLLMTIYGEYLGWFKKELLKKKLNNINIGSKNIGLIKNSIIIIYLIAVLVFLIGNEF